MKWIVIAVVVLGRSWHCGVDRIALPQSHHASVEQTYSAA
jgi:hypothetical protein